jgi:hypothetical protein
MNSPFIEQIYVHQENYVDWLVAVVIPNKKAFKELKGVDLGEKNGDEDVREKNAEEILRRKATENLCYQIIAEEISTLSKNHNLQSWACPR